MSQEQICDSHAFAYRITLNLPKHIRSKELYQRTYINIYQHSLSDFPEHEI